MGGENTLLFTQNVIFLLKFTDVGFYFVISKPEYILKYAQKQRFCLASFFEKVKENVLFVFLTKKTKLFIPQNDHDYGMVTHLICL